MKKLQYLFFILFTIPSFGQINYDAGYIINNNGIKAECLIRNVAWQNNPTEIEFRLNEDDKKTKIANIADIKEFSIGNSYKYKRFNTKIDKSNSEIATLSSEKNPIWKDETLLLKVLVEGEVNLYQYIGNGYQRYFISTGNHEKAEQLIYKEYYAQNNVVTENNAFKQQLFTTLKSDKFTADDFKDLPYEKQKIIDLIIKYNTTKNNQISNFAPKQNQAKTNFKLQLGVNYSDIEIISTSEFETGGIYSATFPKKPVAIIGFEIEYILPINQKKWSLLFSTSFQHYKSETMASNNAPISIDYKTIDILFGVRHYFFLNNQSAIFINGGMIYGSPFNSYSKRERQKYSWEEGTGTIEIKKEIEGNAYAYIGLGYNYHKYNVELRFNSDRELFKSDRKLKSSYSSFGILFSYNFL
ncbi:hypothetical protein [Flavobacterium taihuense]|uniref:Outer membrane protein beta-barrel domain-containing protein n=1 Tax=Flavobacterium taihuense TaxID=2857508 RepID=A0ABS6XW52_9FLAO|nr:hypothetical protein [Flavobacterium taihuense]MBW4360804.1 hypothetical protein [Flavobacterium taihuense]